MSDNLTWALVIPAAVAVGGYLATYYFGVRLARRSDRLARVAAQLQDFYGPMCALVGASNRTWDEFRREHRPGGSYFGEEPPPTEQEMAAWRFWISEVFMPANRRMRDLVVTSAHLLDEDDMPECLLALCAHVSAYEPLLIRWKEQDFAEHKPALPFPRQALSDYATTAFARLKRRQQDLLASRA